MRDHHYFELNLTETYNRDHETIPCTFPQHIFHRRHTKADFLSAANDDIPPFMAT